MNILHICDFGDHITGIAVVLKRLSHEQRLLGHDVNVVSIYKNTSMPDFETICIDTVSNFRLFIETTKPDVVLFHSLWIFKYLKFSRILLKYRIPYGIMMHGANSYVNHKQGMLKKKIANFFFFNKFIKDASDIIFLSKEEYDNCASKNIINNYSILPNGCDTNPLEEIRNDGFSKPIRITYLGRVQYSHKGIDVLIDALKIIHKKYKDIPFLLNFYANENDKDLPELKHDLLSIAKYAKYCGSVYGECKKAVLRNSDLFILTSRYEGMPMGVLEALSYGVPCILTPGTNMAEVIKSNNAGWVADLTAESIACTIMQAVNEYLSNTMYYKMNAYNLSKQYDWVLIAKQSILIYKKYIQ